MGELAVPSLRGVMPSDLAAFLNDWRPDTNDFREARRTDEIVRQVTGLVAAEPAQFAKLAEQFIGGRPRFVWAVLAGLTEAVKKDVPLDWDGPLALCLWVSKQPPDDVKNSPGAVFPDEAGWRWPQKQAADLVVTGLQDGQSGLDAGYFERVIQLIAQLLVVEEPDWRSPDFPDRLLM